MRNKAFSPCSELNRSGACELLLPNLPNPSPASSAFFSGKISGLSITHLPTHPITQSWLDLLHRLGQCRERIFGVAIEHSGYRFEEQRILQPGKALAFATLQHHH